MTEKKKTRENPCKSMRKIINEKKSVYICEICGTKIINKKKSASSAKSA